MDTFGAGTLSVVQPTLRGITVFVHSKLVYKYMYVEICLFKKMQKKTFLELETYNLARLTHAWSDNSKSIFKVSVANQSTQNKSSLVWYILIKVTLFFCYVKLVDELYKDPRFVHRKLNLIPHESPAGLFEIWHV